MCVEDERLTHSIFDVRMLVFPVGLRLFLGTDVLFSKSNFGHVNLNRFINKCANIIKRKILGRTKETTTRYNRF